MIKVVLPKGFNGYNMDLKRFSENKTGDFVKLDGISGLSHAFIPKQLPPQWQIPSHLWPLVVEARAALGSLNGIGKHLPNPQLFLTPLQHREAQLSSQLEGTITNPQQQLLFELDELPQDVSDAKFEAYKEIANYKRALRHHFQTRERLPMSLRLIRELHRLLLEDVRGAENEPGHFRRVQVQIGRPARYVPPPHHLLSDLLHNLEIYLHTSCTDDPLVDAFLVHYQLEAIHPFRDGNGRVGRLLLAIMISERCALSHNWLYMSAFFDAHKDEYMDRLFNVSASGDWTGWIEFCLRGAISQARDTEIRCTKLLEVANKLRKRLPDIGASARLFPIVDQLFISPVIGISTLARQLEVSYPTAKANVEKLVEAGILTEFKDFKPRTFYNQEIFDLIFEPMELNSPKT